MSRGVLLTGRTFLVVLLAALFLLPGIVVFSPDLVPTETNSVLQRELPSSYVEKTFFFGAPVFEEHWLLDSIDVKIQGTGTYHSVGSPAVPCESVIIALPPDTLPTQVNVMASEPIEIPLDGTLSPVPEDIPISDTYEMYFGEPDHVPDYFDFGPQYQKDEFFPADNFEYDTSFGLSPAPAAEDNIITISTDKRSQYVDVFLFPIRYNPVQDTMLYYSEMTLMVEYAQNPEYHLSSGSRAEGSYDMVIITPQAQEATYKGHADYRNTTSVITRVVTLEDIYAGNYFGGYSSAADNQEKIKLFIKDAIENWDISFVLLGADHPDLPIRYIEVDQSDGNFNNVPSDLYYSDIYKSGGVFADWNVDDDSKWGEYDNDRNDMDLRPDVTIGRLPSDSNAEAVNMVDKVQNYEVNAYESDWFKRFTMLGTDTFDGSYGDTSGFAEGEEVMKNLDNNYYTDALGFTCTRLFQSNSLCRASNFLKPNNQSAGFIAFSDHGFKTGWESGAEAISRSNIQSMSNGYKLPIVSIDACLTGAFDYSSDCFAETFLKDDNGGGVAVLASSRISLGTVGQYPYYGVSGLMNTQFHVSYISRGYDQVGEMYSGGEMGYYNSPYTSPKNSGSDFLVMTEYVFFGDPSTYIGGFSRTHGKISCDDTDKKVEPGIEVVYNITVENNGTGQANCFVITQRSDGSPVPLDWEHGFGDEEFVLNAGQTKNIFMNVTPPEDADTNLEMDIVLKVLSPNIEEAPLEVSTVTTVKPIFDVDLGSPDSEKMVEPGGSAVYSLKLTNFGNSDFLFDMSVVDEPDGWEMTFSESTVTLPLDGTTSFTLTVKPDNTVLSGTYLEKVRATLKTDTSFFEEIVVSTSVNKSNGFKLDPVLFSSKETEAGVKTDFGLLVENTGNHDDTIALSFPNADTLTGWRITATPSLNIDLAAFSSGETTIDVTPPSNALAGEYEITVMGTLDSDSTTKFMYFTVKILEDYDFGFGTDDSVRSGKTGTQVTYNITISNSGNIVDTYDLDIKVKPKDWTVSLDPALTVDAYDSIVTSLVVSIPDEELAAGTYNISLEAQSRGSKRSIPLVVSVVVPHSYSMEVDTEVLQVELLPGEKVKFLVTIRNTGNVEDTYEASNSAMSLWDVDISKTEIVISEFSEDQIMLEVTPPENAYIGVYTFSLKISSRSQAFIEEKLEFSVFIKQVYAVELVAISGPIKITDSGDVDFAYKSSNLGNGPDDLIFTLEDVPENWDLDLDNEVSVNSGKDHTGSVDMVIPEKGTKAGTYEIILTATSKGDSTVSQSITMEVTLEKTPEENSPIPDIVPGFGSSDSKSSSGNLWFFLLIIVAVLIGIIIVVAVVVGKRRKSNGKEEVDETTILEPTIIQPPAAKPATAPQGQAYRSSGPEYMSGEKEKQSTKAKRSAVYAVPSKDSNTLPPPQKVDGSAMDWEEDEEEDMFDLDMDDAPYEVSGAHDDVLPPPPPPEDLEPDVNTDGEPDWDDAFSLED